jgi:hypothetical protein
MHQSTRNLAAPARQALLDIYSNVFTHLIILRLDRHNPAHPLFQSRSSDGWNTSDIRRKENSARTVLIFHTKQFSAPKYPLTLPDSAIMTQVLALVAVALPLRCYHSTL